jgi:transposase
MKKELLKALNLPDEIQIERIDSQEKIIDVFCKTKKRNLKCPHCSGKANGYDTVKNRKLHTVLNGKKVWLNLVKRRMRCKACKRVFTEPIEGMGQYRTTEFFNQLVQEKSRNQDFASVARELGIHSATVMRKQDLLELDRFMVPDHDNLWLGLDGKFLNSEDEIFVIGEIKKRQFLGVTKGGKADELEKLLKEKLLDNGKTVELVTMDMSRLLKGVAQNLFGKDIPIVSDKFHVIKHVNSVIDLCRIAMEKSVNERFQIKRLLLMKNETLTKIKDKPKWKQKVKKFKQLLETHTELKVLWDLKNRVHGFYRVKTEKKAREQFDGIINFLDSYTSTHPEFADLKRTLLNWKTEILNYFKYRITNAYIEGLNNRIETLKRKRFGFRNKERFIKTLLFAFLPVTMFLSNLIFTH